MTKLALLLALLALPLPAQDVPPMDPKADPSFEVATINPTDPADQHGGYHTNGHRIFVENVTLNSLLSVSYEIHSDQIIGAPAWSVKDRFDIHGVPDFPGQPSWNQQKTMIQKLLADRFQLKFHREKRELPIYTITVLKSGPKLTLTKSDPNSLPDQTCNGSRTRRECSFRNYSLTLFAQSMQFFLPRPVTDETGLTAKYDFHLIWTPEDTTTEDPNAPPGLFTAIQEQLGLKLEPTRAPAPVLIIDHVERPSNN